MKKTGNRSVSFGSILIIAVMLACLKPVFAYRPFGTEDAGVGKMGEMALELAYDHTSITPLTGSDYTRKAGVFAFVFGLGFGEVAVEGPYWIDNGEGEKGVGDLTFFAKILLLGKSEDEGMLTVKAEFTVTTGDEKKGLGEEDRVYSPSLVFTRAFNPVQIHLQGGYEYVDDGENDSNSWVYGAAVDFGISDRFSLVGEINGAYNSDSSPVTYLAGIIFSINDTIALDAAYSAPLNSDAKDGTDGWWNIMAGITLAF